LAALQALAGVVQPLAANLSLQCIDPQTGYAIGGTRPALAFHHLRRSALPAGVHGAALFAGAACSQAPTLDAATLRDWVVDVLTGAGCATGTSVGWDSLRVDASLARLASADAESLPLLRAGTEVALAAVEHDAQGAWASGPVDAYPDQPPIALALSNDAGALRLTIAVHWSPWSEPASAEGMALARACEQLKAQGWTEGDD
ncbi:MAG: hypothetical protein Q7N95_07475, partial [Alphaproteobacteria bacterium]|nr:hypothetical protein [Alphaproteobacteria bacterium]